MSCEQVLAADHPLPRHEPRSFEHVHLRPEPTAAREARSFVRTRAPQLGDDHLAALLTATSELVTNAVLHARSNLVVGITVSPSVVLVTVGDRAPRHPESRSHSDRRESGRGIALVRALADDWGVVPLPDRDGKSVWFTVLRDAVDHFAPPRTSGQNASSIDVDGREGSR